MNIDNPYIEGMVTQIYPPELQFNKTNSTDTKAPVLDLHLLYQFQTVLFHPKIHDKCDDLILTLLILRFFEGKVPRTTFYDFYISQLIRFARVSRHLDDFNV